MHETCPALESMVIACPLPPPPPPPNMEGSVITDVLNPPNLTRRVDGVASAITGILMHDEDHFAMIGIEEGSADNNV